MLMYFSLLKIYLIPSKLIFIVISGFLFLNGCQQLPRHNAVLVGSTGDRQNTDSELTLKPSKATEIIWLDKFQSANWQQNWQIKPQKKWGLENIQIMGDPSGKFEKILRVNYPGGSASPTVHRKYNTPIGGTSFYAELGIKNAQALRLSYNLRFGKNFNFVRGGKLPGLFGGNGASGGKIPDGSDGFSTRFMWRKQGDGEIYAYLPTSVKHGTSIGRGNWRFQPDRWYRLEQEVILNDPGVANGQIRVWLDGKQVLERGGLTFRQSDQLNINGIFFSTFFGGSDPSWATPQDVHVDFADFSVSTVKTDE